MPPLQWRPPLHVAFYQIAGSPHFAVRTDFSITAWDATVEMARVHSPIWPACWVQCPDRSRRSSLEACAYDVDASWQIWSKEAEASLVRANHTASGPALTGPRSCTAIYPSALGGWGVGVRNESTALIMPMSLMLQLWVLHQLVACPRLRFRRRFKSDCNVVKGITTHGFAGASMSALWYRWAAVTKMGPSGPITSFEPWTRWIPQTSMGFTSVSWTLFSIRNEFLFKVVHCGQNTSLPCWSNWIRENLSSHPYQWLRSDFNPRAPCLVCDPRILPKGLGYWFRRLSSVPIFEKHGCRTFAGKGHPVVSPQALFEFVGDHLPQEDFLDMPILTGEELHGVVMTRKSTAGGLDGWAWNEVSTFCILVCGTGPSSTPNRSCREMAPGPF